ncbi:MAG: fluoride efflux transporter CrcB [Neisseriaceae bacterium]|nr:fluoride efflux transporter CrcB [Neisseriaceae bacterium]MBQ9620272.1 fluoride efflux transporter CrcB [Neisseriaceae bacterium]
MKSFLWVAIGSGIGGALRYGVSLIVKSGSGFPLSTLCVNTAGSFLLGLIFAIFNKNNAVQSDLFLLLSVGVCGGLTTFSTFSKESVQLLQQGLYGICATYILSSFILGIGAMFLGIYCVQAA